MEDPQSPAAAAPAETPRLRTASESVGWMNSVGPLTVSPSFSPSAESPAAAIQQRAETPEHEITLSDLVVTARHYLGPDWGDPADDKRASFLLFAINHMGGIVRDYSILAAHSTAQAQEIARLRAQVEKLQKINTGNA